jgi:thiamine transport system permease protein
MDRTVHGDGAAVSHGATAGRRRRGALLAVGPVVFLAVLFAYPLALVVARGFGADDVLIAPLRDVLLDPYLRGVARFTLLQAIASTLLTLAVGLPVAAVLSRLEFRGRGAIEAATLVPFVLPTVVVGTAFVALLARLSPVVDLRRTVAAILLAHVFFNVSVVVRTVGGLWRHLDAQPVHAARTLGASPLRAFFEVTLPRLRPAIGAASAVVFLFTFTSFGVVLILGGPGRSTLEVEIHRATAQLLDLRTAAALSVLQLLAVIATLGAYDRTRRRHAARPLARAAATGRPVTTTADRLAVAGAVSLLAVIQGLPLLALVERSLRVGDGWGFAHYRTLGGPTRETVLSVAPALAVRNSVTLAAAATLIALIVGTSAALAAVQDGRTGRIMDGALMLPLGTSAVTLGLGLLLAFRSGPLAGRGAVLLVPLAQALVAIPFVVRTMLPVLRGIDERLREAAATLGATPRRVWQEIDLPIVSRAGLVAAGFAFAVTIGEFGATIFVARAANPTMPVAIHRALGLPGEINLGRAMALSVLLAAITGVVVLLIDRLRIGSVGRF